jgi:hypothetical protein
MNKCNAHKKAKNNNNSAIFGGKNLKITKKMKKG